MKLRRALFVVAILSLLSVLAVPAQAAADNPYWEVETNIPVETIQGEWTVAHNGRSATLEFDGVNVVGQTTRFTAGWTTPWVRGSHSDGGEFIYLVDPLANGKLRTEIRTQAKGEPWSDWFGGSFPFRDGGGGYLWDGGSFGFGRGPLRYEWRMVGTISGNGYIEGSAEISV